MPAFTMLFEKVNISLFEDTITLYPKLNGQMHTLNEGAYVYSVHPLGSVTQNNDWRLKDKIHYVQRQEHFHLNYHKDNFDREKLHTHWQFPKIIDENKLKEIFAFFLEYELISMDERVNFIHCFRIVQNNLELPSANFSLQNTNTSIELLSNQIDLLNPNDTNRQTFIAQLKIMANKALELKKKAQDNEKYCDAALDASFLCTSLYEAYLKLDIKSKQSCLDFKDSCDKSMAYARVELEQHREWGALAEALANLAIAIVTLGLGYLAYGLYNKYHNNDRFIFFRIDTDAIEKQNSLQSAVDGIHFVPEI
jgi:hypothetical protein